MIKHLAFIGIDPGSAGYICVLVPELDKRVFMEMSNNPLAIREFLRASTQKYQIQIVMIEDVAPVPGTSAGSNFKFGWNAGGINWLVESMALKLDRVRPKKWQSTLNIRVAQSLKGTARKRAIKKKTAEVVGQLYPHTNLTGPRGGLLDGKSDSLAIAHFAFMQYNTR